MEVEDNTVGGKAVDSIAVAAVDRVVVGRVALVATEVDIACFAEVAIVAVVGVAVEVADTYDDFLSWILSV